MRGNSFASVTGKAIPPASLGGSSALVLIEAHEFVAPATGYTFSGLDGDVDAVYLIEYRIIKAVTAALNVDIRPNGATTAQQTRGVYAGTSTGTFNPSTLRIVFNGSVTADDVIAGQFWLAAATGAMRTGRANWTDTDGTNLFLLDAAMLWNEGATNITSLEVLADTASGIEAGSYVRLYRLEKT